MKSILITEIEMKTDELEYELTRNGKELSIGAENVLNEIRELIETIDEEYTNIIEDLQEKIENPDIKKMIYCMVHGEAHSQEQLPILVEALKENGVI